MRDFPPVVPEFTSTAAPVGSARRAGARRARRTSRIRTPGQPRATCGGCCGSSGPLLVLLCFLAMLQWLPGAVGPYLVGQIIDEGILGGDSVGGLAVRGRAARPRPAGRHGRRARPHLHRPLLADRDVRLDEAGHPEDHPDGARAAAAGADRRGAQRRRRRLRSDGRAHRGADPRGRCPAGVPGDRRHRAAHVAGARAGRAADRAAAGDLGHAAAEAVGATPGAWSGPGCRT